MPEDENGAAEAPPPHAVKAAALIAGQLATPRALALVPTAMVAGYLMGGPTLLLAAGMAPPLAHGLRSMLRGTPHETDSITGLPRRDGVTAHLDRTIRRNGLPRATCLVVEVDRFDIVTERFGHAAAEGVTRQIAERIAATCRPGDAVGRLHGNAFAIAFAPSKRTEMDGAIRLATRLQSALSEPLPIEGTAVHLTASVGFCLAGLAPDAGGEDVLTAAESALAEARRGGPASIRAYSAEMHERVSARSSLVADAEGALEGGQIVPWFQPQVDSATGALTGIEALARWAHPERGMIPPSEFLPALEQAGLMGRLGDVMLRQALSALRAWEDAGLSVPSVSVNFSSDELRAPDLVDRIQWALDAQDLAPPRLTVEVLETVVSGTDEDAMTRNLHRLAALGCHIDLDDFGTGNASIGNIRRFSITRIKIDRSFVIGIEEEVEQRRMISAILTMADRLNLETVAEGVETEAAHTILSQLGCGHVQGFGIARPMPQEDVTRWIARQAPSMGPLVQDRRRAG